MAIPYRHRRTIQRVATITLTVVLIALVAWLAWIVWLQRYVVYTEDGAKLDFDLSSNDITGELADPPREQMGISIFYNEGANAINTEQEMEQINGYYITSDMFQTDVAGLLKKIAPLEAGTAMMIDMKGPYGSFFYNTKINGAVLSASTDIPAVEDLVKKCQMKGFYTIARVSALRDWDFGNSHVTSGLYMTNRRGLWMDQGGYFWLDPTNATVINHLSSMILELRDMGFNEVLLDNFRFPVSDQYLFNGDKPAALLTCAEKLIESCATDNFVISFCVEDPAFALPEGRTRIYLSNIDPASIARQASLATVTDPEIRLVFLCETGDTRYDEYSVLRSINVAEEVEARKSNIQAQQE